MSDLKKWLMTDIEDFPEAEVSSSEKNQMNRRLLGKKRKAPWLAKLALAAGIFLASAATATIAFPSLASQIPVLQNIVSYFDGDELIFNHFSEMAQPIGLAKTSNGTTVAIEEAVYDGTSVTISFALKTEKDLGKFPNTSGLLEASGAGGSGSVTVMEKVDDTTYAGMITMAPDFFFGPPSTLNLSWKPEAFEDMETGTRVSGDWAFEFKLKAIDSEKVSIGKEVSFEGGSYTLDKLKLTKLSTVMTLSKDKIDENHYMTEWQLKDDLGNIYPMQFGTGSESRQQFTFEALDPAASSVTIIPTITYVENVEDEGIPVDASSVSIEIK